MDIPQLPTREEVNTALSLVKLLMPDAIKMIFTGHNRWDHVEVVTSSSLNRTILADVLPNLGIPTEALNLIHLRTIDIKLKD